VLDEAAQYFRKKIQEIQPQILKSGAQASPFQLDFEVTFALLLCTQIDGEITAKEQLWERRLIQSLEWSKLHQNLLQNKVHQEPSFDLSLFRLHQQYVPWTAILYPLCLVTFIVDWRGSDDVKNLIQKLRLHLFASDTEGTLQTCEAELFAEPWMLSAGWSLEDWQKKLPIPTELAHQSQSPAKTLDESLAALDALVGLEEVKKNIRNLIDFLRIQKERQNHGLSVVRPNLHMVFTGNPGTGKTTVARIVADVYRSLGFLAKGHLIETDRGGLVGQYVGHTEEKTRSLVQKALGGILFIDEAYALYREGGNDFGREAIDTLVKEIEDNREKLVVIVAGYKDEMELFIQANPGLQSRFNTFIEFANYKPAELQQIFQRIAEKNQYQVTPSALEKLQLIMDTAVKESGRTFGNGRYVRNLFERVIRNQALRLSMVKTLDRQQLIELDAPDFVS